MEPRIVERLLDDLFSAEEDVHNPEEIWRNRNVYDPAYSISSEEVAAAIRGRRRGGCPALGLDDLSLDIWKRVPGCVIDDLAILYTRCLEEGKIPIAWKRAILVLIPKGPVDVKGKNVVLKYDLYVC